MEGCISVLMGGGVERVHRETGKEIKMVRRGKSHEYLSECRECGKSHKEVIYNYSLDRRFASNNIEERIIPPTKCYIPVYSNNG